MKPVPPCKGCDHRHAVCHGSCPEFIKYKEDVEAFNKLDRTQKSRYARTNNQLKLARLKALGRC